MENEETPTIPDVTFQIFSGTSPYREKFYKIALSLFESDIINWWMRIEEDSMIREIHIANTASILLKKISEVKYQKLMKNWKL